MIDKFLALITSNTVVAALIVFGIVVIAVSKFTDAVDKIYQFFNKLRGAKKTEKPLARKASLNL
jgi:hypothetical protein